MLSCLKIKTLELTLYIYLNISAVLFQATNRCKKEKKKLFILLSDMQVKSAEARKQAIRKGNSDHSAFNATKR